MSELTQPATVNNSNISPERKEKIEKLALSYFNQCKSTKQGFMDAMNHFNSMEMVVGSDRIFFDLYKSTFTSAAFTAILNHEYAGLGELNHLIRLSLLTLDQPIQTFSSKHGKENISRLNFLKCLDDVIEARKNLEYPFENLLEDILEVIDSFVRVAPSKN